MIAVRQKLCSKHTRKSKSASGPCSYHFGILTTSGKDIFHSRYHAELLSGIFDRVARLGHDLKLFAWPVRRASSLDQILADHDLDGLLILTWRWIHPQIAELIETTRQERVLVVNDPMPGLRVNVVYTDTEAGMDLAAGHLAKKGYRKIGMLHGPMEVTFREGGKKIKSPFIDTRLKKEGFLKAMKVRKLLTPSAWIRATEANSEQEGYRVMKKWLREKTMPEAIICGNDDLALGAMKAIKEAGKMCPRILR